MKITCLLENTAKRGDVITEHGLSLYIETGECRILFDMGQSDAFLKNAAQLGIDLGGVDFAVLSHGHYDHGGGLEAFLSINKNTPVYLHRDAFLPHYNGTEKYIGLDTGLKNNPRLCFTTGKTAIAPTLTLFEGATVSLDAYAAASGLTEQTASGFQPDDFRHEQYLLVEEGGKKILFSGCSHRGILGITAHFKPSVLIGGFHFSKRPLDDALLTEAKALATGGTVFYTCHCTGEAQYRFMKPALPQLHYLACGESITI